MHRTRKFLLLTLLIVGLLPGVLVAQDDAPPPAEIQDDEGGVAIIRGEYAYSDPSLPDYGIQPVVFMGDASNIFVEDGFDFSTEYLDVNSTQILAQSLSDIREGPLQYELLLPIDPSGGLHDVDNDAEEDAGVSVFVLAFTFNGIDDPLIDEREFIYYSSLTLSQDFETQYQINGGRMIVFAPEEGQGFPSGFGEDGELFTEDDPIVTLPAGYTVVDFSTDPFTFIGSHEAEVNIVESEGTEFTDFSSLSYTGAFDAMMAMMRNEYAFTEFKNVDWDALIAEYRPRFEEAEANQDRDAYLIAMNELSWEIPDGHIGTSAFNEDPVFNKFVEETGGGLGMAIRELDDGRIITNYILEGGPAAEAGIELRAEILQINGRPTADVVSENVPWSSPFSNADNLRLQQLRYAIRFPVGTDVEVTYQNPEAAEPTTVTLTTIEERQSFSFSSFNTGLTGYELPVEFELLDSGYGYIKIYSFSDDNFLSLALFQRAIRTFNANGVPGIIIDMRQNGGGSPDIGNVMMGYFFDEVTYAGTSAFYYADIDRFEFDPLYDTTILPSAEADRYRGEVAVLIGPSCYSMCEFFTYGMTLAGAAVVGQYPTGGLGGGIKQFAMPEGLINQFTVGRAVGADNEIHIEGTGVPPTIEVPVDEETLFSEGDPILETAQAYLTEALAAEIIDGGAIAVGETISGTLEENQRVRYALPITAADLFTIRLSDPTGELDTYLWLYLEGEEEPVLENDDGETNAPNSEIPELQGDKDETIYIEVGTFEDASAGEYTLEIINLNAEGATEATAEAATEVPAETATQESTATEEAAPAATEEASAPVGTIVDTAIANEDLSTLVTAVTIADQTEALAGEGPFTVFAPNNDAFNALGAETLSAAMNDETLLNNILLYHVVTGTYTAEDLAALDGQTIPTLYEGHELAVTVDGDGNVLVDGVKVVLADVTATNGVIHIIESVLIPPME